jgi:hypothetical protein
VIERKNHRALIVYHGNRGWHFGDHVFAIHLINFRRNETLALREQLVNGNRPSCSRAELASASPAADDPKGEEEV